MALRFIDGGDGYDGAHALQKWTIFGFPTTVTINATNGRRGSPSIRSVDWKAGLAKTLDNQVTYIIGFAYRCSVIPSAPRFLVGVRDAGTIQCCISVNPTGTISAYRGDTTGTFLGSSAAPVIIANTYCYLEIQITINNTTGIMSARKDGVSVLNLTAQNNRSTANNTADTVIWFSNAASDATAVHDIDDLYILDGTGATNNAFLGDCRVDNTVANGAGNISGWQPFSASPTFQNIDDGISNDDVDYNFTSTPAARELYAFPNIAPTVGTVFGVVVNATVRKEDATVRTFRDLVRSGVTNFPGSVIFSPTTSYVRYMTVHEVDPNTTAQWTLANVNAAEFGIDLVS